MWSSSGREREAGKVYALSQRENAFVSRCTSPVSSFIASAAAKRRCHRLSGRSSDVLHGRPQDLASRRASIWRSSPLTPAERARQDETESERERMFHVDGAAATFFSSSTSLLPARPPAPTSRGVASAGGGRALSVGYAPSRWDGLSAFLAGKKIPRPSWSISAWWASTSAGATTSFGTG